MRREQLEHVLRAAARIVAERDFLVVGSAAMLDTFDEAQLTVEATRSDEATSPSTTTPTARRA